MARIVYEGHEGIRTYEGDFYHSGQRGVLEGFVAIYDDSDTTMEEKHIPLSRVYAISMREAKDIDVPPLAGEHV